MEVTTRLATSSENDLDKIHRLLDQFREEFGYGSFEGPLPALDGPDGTFNILLAELDGDAVGLLALQRCHTLAQGASFLLLSDIFVATTARRRGVAKAMMTAVKELAASLGCKGMSLMVSEVNMPALTTAARAGFTRHDQLLFNYSEESSSG
jgi:GNAT superfamily N-acetyltransferase